MTCGYWADFPPPEYYTWEPEARKRWLDSGIGRHGPCDNCGCAGCERCESGVVLLTEDQYQERRKLDRQRTSRT